MTYPNSLINLIDTNGEVRPLIDIEDEALRFALQKYENVAKAARQLRIGRTTFYRKILDRKIREPEQPPSDSV